MRALLRILYRGMIRLYPASFRSEFGEEMLWIFDEESRADRTLPLFLDASRAIVVRRIRPRSEKFAASGYYVEIDSALPAQKVAQTLLAILYFGAGLAMMTAPAILWILK
jgi:hypothetical protein